MAAWTTTTVATAVLALSALQFFNWKAPEPPMTAGQTELLVGACALVVVCGQWLIRSVRSWTRRP